MSNTKYLGTGRVEGNPDGCTLATSRGSEGCNYSDEDKIGLGNCELKTKIHFHSFSYKESKTKHTSGIVNGVKKIKNTDKIDKLISDAFLKSSVKELEKAIKIYLENKEVYKEEADIWNEEKYYGRAKSIIENNSLNIQIERI